MASAARMEITSKENRLIKEAAKLLSSRKYREEQKLFLAEGARLTLDALRSNIKIFRLFTTKTGRERYPEIVSSLEEAAEESYGISPQLA